jgi:hypothetical protein
LSIAEAWQRVNTDLTQPSLDVKTIEDFNKVTSLLEGGLEKALERQKQIEDFMLAIKNQKQKLIDEHSTIKEINKILKPLEKQYDDLEKQLEDLANQREAYYELSSKARYLREVILLSAGAVGVLGAAYALTQSNNISQQKARERNEKYKKALQENKREWEMLPIRDRGYLFNHPNATEWPGGSEILTHPADSVSKEKRVLPRGAKRMTPEVDKTKLQKFTR